VIEPWAGGYSDPKLPVAARSNYAQREQLLALKRALGPGSPTAVVTHGANPGLVSHFVKAALLRVAAASGLEPASVPCRREEWAALAAALGVRAIHVSERDSQAPAVPKAPNEFVNTWSVDGFIAEGCQPAELGWGTHERQLPADAATHDAGCGAAVYLQRPGAATRVRSWCPGAGAFHGFLVTHNEAISIADFLTLRDPATGAVQYRPTVHYAYHPCDAALASLHELAGRNWAPQASKRILCPADVVGGCDELGVLLCGMPAPAPASAFWFGSALACADAAAAAEGNSATTLQVTASVLGGLVWALEHPRAGVVEPEEMEAGGGWRHVLDIAEPYVAPLVGVWSAWTPLEGRGAGSGSLFPEQLDESDPWQFTNVRVA
jgi:homospermidine synthase